MDTSKLKDIAELVGIIAIVASLIAVIAELGQTQSALAAATYQARSFDAMDKNWDIATDPHLTRLFSTYSLSDPELPEQLDAEDYVRVRSLMVVSLLDMDNEYFQYQQGFLDEEYFEHWFKPSLRRNALRWRRFGLEERRPSFRAFVDEQLAQTE